MPIYLDLYQSPKNQNTQGYQMPIYGLTPISQGKTKHGYQMPIYLDLFQSPQDDHRNTSANNMDLQLHPHIQQTNKHLSNEHE